MLTGIVSEDALSEIQGLMKADILKPYRTCGTGTMLSLTGRVLNNVYVRSYKFPVTFDRVVTGHSSPCDVLDSSNSAGSVTVRYIS